VVLFNHKIKVCHISVLSILALIYLGQDGISVKVVSAGLTNASGIIHDGELIIRLLLAHSLSSICHDGNDLCVASLDILRVFHVWVLHDILDRWTSILVMLHHHDEQLFEVFVKGGAGHALLFLPEIRVKSPVNGLVASG